MIRIARIEQKQKIPSTYLALEIRNLQILSGYHPKMTSLTPIESSLNINKHRIN